MRTVIVNNPLKSHFKHIRMFVGVCVFTYNNLEDILEKPFIKSTVWTAFSADELHFIFMAVNVYLSGLNTSTGRLLPQHLPTSPQEPLSHAELSRDTRESLD